MSFPIARCGTSIPSRTVSSSAWTLRKAKRARTQPHLQHSPDTSMCQDLPLLPERERHADRRSHLSGSLWLDYSLTLAHVHRLFCRSLPGALKMLYAHTMEFKVLELEREPVN